MRSDLAASALADAGLDRDEVMRIVACALDEDLRYGPDVTSEATILPGARASAVVAARKPGVVAGVPVALAVLDAAGGGLDVEVVAGDGSRIKSGDVILRVTGPTRALLLAERPMLNLLSHLSGVATATRGWVDAVAGTGAAIRDTRKTIPGLRHLQKYAVRCGGGVNHRLGLGDAALVKDNHVAAAGGISAAVRSIRANAPDVSLQVECDTVDEVREALEAGVRTILLDNMTAAEMRAAVAMSRLYPHVMLEASGGIALERARETAEAGVDYIAVGSLTHSAQALDIGLDFDRRSDSYSSW